MIDDAFDGTDSHAINGKIPAPVQRYDLVVVGAGPAGLAAALEGAEAGRTVLLVDENPVSGSLMSTDVPLYYGGRMTAAVQTKERMFEQIFAAEPLLEPLFEAGVEVALGTYAWGLYRNASGVAALPEPMLGLADEERSWMVGFDRLILATGARDLALAFPGWDQPGVMGAQGFHALTTRYDAFAGRRMLVLGSHDLALRTALLAIEKGVELLGLVEILDVPQGDPVLVEQLRAAGIAIRCGTVIRQAQGGVDGVERIVLGAVTGGADETIECDTICVAIDTVPAIELLDAAGGKIVTDATRGGHVSQAVAGEAVPGIFIAGDCAGLLGDPVLAAAQGKAAARAALGLGLDEAAMPAAPEGFDRLAYRTAWLRALVEVSPPETIVCQCEEVTRADLLGVQPPRYLDRTERLAARSLDTLLLDGPPDQEQVKRLTRACMGACQARRCREQVSMLLGVASNLPPEQAPRAGWRAPVRPLPLKVLADWEESDAMRDGWDVWFGIPTQWIPYRDIGTEREAERIRDRAGDMHL